MFLVVGLTALVMGVATPFGIAFVWGVPFGMLSTRMVLSSGLTASAGTLLIGLSIEGCLFAGGAPATGAMGALVGAVFMGTLSLSSAWRMRHLRGLVLMASRLSDPTIRDRAAEAIERILGRVRSRHADADHAVYAELLLLVVNPLTDAGRWEQAERLLRELPLERVPAHLVAARHQALATCRLELGDLAGARAVVASAERPLPTAALERWMRTLEALFFALEGDGEEALSLLESAAREVPEEAYDGSLEDALAASEEVVRAHAYASLGDVDAAKDALRSARRAGGRKALDRAIHPAGPASELARTVRAEDPGPEDDEDDEDDADDEDDEALGDEDDAAVQPD